MLRVGEWALIIINNGVPDRDNNQCSDVGVDSLFHLSYQSFLLQSFECYFQHKGTCKKDGAYRRKLNRICPTGETLPVSPLQRFKWVLCADEQREC